MYKAYVLYSERLDKYYVGSTQDLDDRLSRHNAGRSKYTKSGVPWQLVTSFDFESRSDAVKLENKIKKRGIKRFLDDNDIRGIAQSG